jgi:hypothetical protein
LLYHTSRPHIYLMARGRSCLFSVHFPLISLARGPRFRNYLPLFSSPPLHRLKRPLVSTSVSFASVIKTSSPLSLMQRHMRPISLADGRRPHPHVSSEVCRTWNNIPSLLFTTPFITSSRWSTLKYPFLSSLSRSPNHLLQ